MVPWWQTCLPKNTAGMAERTEKMDSRREDLIALEDCVCESASGLCWGNGKEGHFASGFFYIDLWKPGAGVPYSLYPEQNPIQQVKGIQKQLHSLSRRQLTKNVMGNQTRSPHLHLFLAVQSLRLRSACLLQPILPTPKPMAHQLSSSSVHCQYFIS